MIKHIRAHSPNQGLYEGLHHLRVSGLKEPSRVGDTIVSPMPVMTTYVDPTARVLCSPLRDANPFFHLFESLWMLAGRNDLAFPQTFVSTFGQFSDDGATLNGAYGYRWREYFGYDQLKTIAEMLRQPGRTRRAVLQMWDGGTIGSGYDGDLERALTGSSDVPCNTAAYFDTIGGNLNMTVTCRSNDIILGAYGANVVHMSFLLEYMCAMTGLPMGVYRQFSNDFHAYTEQLSFERFGTYADAVAADDIYSQKTHQWYEARGIAGPKRVPLMGPLEEELWHEDLSSFMTWVDGWSAEDLSADGSTYDEWAKPQTEFFKTVVAPMARAWRAWKGKRFEDATEHTYSIRADDWRAASQQWLSTRAQTRERNGK